MEWEIESSYAALGQFYVSLFQGLLHMAYAFIIGNVLLFCSNGPAREVVEFRSATYVVNCTNGEINLALLDELYI